MLSRLRYCCFTLTQISLLALLPGLADAAEKARGKAVKSAEIAITSHVDPKNIGYSRRAYENELIELLLTKTRDNDNNLRTQQASFNSNSARELRIMQEHPEINFIRTFAASNELILNKKLRYIPFPIMRGALSYRICLSSKTTQRALLANNGIQDFKRFTHVQGLGWQDTKILRHAGFTVIEAGAYSALVEMVVRNRADLLCRGANEIQSDWFEFNRKLSSLVIEDNILIFYPLPRYFFTHVKNKALLDRIARGLEIARQDGSFMRLWEKHHLLGLENSHLEKRRLIALENPFIDKIPQNFNVHFYKIPAYKDEKVNQAGSGDSQAVHN